MEKKHPWPLKQSESVWLFSQAGTTHNETAGWTSGLARSDRHQADSASSSNFWWTWASGKMVAETERSLQTCITLQGKMEGNRSRSSLSSGWLMHDTSIDSDRGCLMLQVKWVLYIARFKRVRLRWKQLSWETSEVPDPQRNTASFGKWAQLQKSWRLFWPWRDLQACAEELLQPQAQKVVEAHNKIKHKR